MRKLEGNQRVSSLQRVARLRVTLGFVVAGVAFWFATPSWGSRVVGALFAAVGETVRVWAAGHIRKGQEVTCSGPYRITRHPLYLGSFVIGIGFVIVAASVLVAGVIVGYLVVMLSVAVAFEEATLRQTFGTEYDRYAAGQLEASDRRFSLSLAVENGEFQTVLGFAAALGVLALKVWFSRSGSGI